MAKKVKSKRVMSEEHKKKISEARLKRIKQNKRDDNNEKKIMASSNGNNSKNKDEKGRFVDGHTLAKGRPKGSKNTKTIILEIIGEDNLEWMINQEFEAAMNGNAEARRYLLDKVLTRAAPEPVHTFSTSNFVLPPIKAASEINDAMEQVLLAVQDGSISHEEGAYWYDKLERKVKAISVFEWEPFIEKMLELKKRGQV